jgi:hypothetical protein
MNKFLMLFLGIAVIGAVFIIGSGYLGTKPATVAPADTKPDTSLCTQVITSARNPVTGQIKEYPTPCDVPPTWEVIVNEVPGL